MGVPQREGRAWIVLLAVPIGLTAWIPPIKWGVEARRAAWVLLGLLTAAVLVSAMVVSEIEAEEANTSGGLFILAWIMGIGVTLAIRPAYRRAIHDPLARAELAARDRVRERRRAQEMARREPEVARELGIGRPDLRGARHAGLVDVNHAPAEVLARLPGLDDATAARIVAVREDVDGFESVEELGHVVHLDGGVVEDLRDRTVFLPR
jgi:hypothetical protein